MKFPYAAENGFVIWCDSSFEVLI